MPIYLKEVDVVSEVAKFQSALIVICRFCPAASLAVRNDKPFIEFFRRLPFNISLEKFNVTPMIYPGKQSEKKVSP